MLKPLTIAAVLTTGLTMGAGTAIASPYNTPSALTHTAPAIAAGDVTQIHHSHRKYQRHYHGRYSPKQIRRILRHRGFRDVRIVEVRGNRVVARAYGRRGPVRLLVSRKTGEVIARKRVGYNRHHYGNRKHHYHGHRHHKDGGSITFGFGFRL